MTHAPLRILIVDDNEDSARMMRMLLKLEGHEVRLAFDGASALREAAEFLPEVSLLDLTLPDMSGVAVASALRDRPEMAGAAIVAVSGLGEETLPSPSPFDRYFVKPLDHEVLKAFLAEYQSRP